MPENKTIKDQLINSFSQVLLLATILLTGIAGIFLPISQTNQLVIILAMMAGLITAIFYYKDIDWHAHNNLEVMIDLIFISAIFIVLFAAKNYGIWLFFWLYIITFVDALIYSYWRLFLVDLLITFGLILYFLIFQAILPVQSIVLILLNIFSIWLVSHFIWFYSRDSRLVVRKGEQALKKINFMKINEENRSEFLHLASHQLKNPLAIIRFILIKLSQENKVNKKRLEEIKQALFQSGVALEFLDDITRILKAETQSEILKKEEVDIENLFKELIHEMHPFIIKKKINLIKEITGILPNINTDLTYLKIALTNLIDNAIKYSSTNSRIIIAVRQLDNQSIEFTITDFGIGIAQADQWRIGNKFFRGSNAKSLVPQGTGLGLYLVKLISKRLRGKLTFRSSLNKGSTFFLTIPLN